jgi:hypothetical protein
MKNIKIGHCTDLERKYSHLEIFYQNYNFLFMEIGISDEKELIFKFYPSSVEIVLSVDDWDTILTTAKEFLPKAVKEGDDLEERDKLWELSRRKPTQQEIKLIEFLAAKGSINLPFQWEDKLIVVPLEDGNMVSLSLFPMDLADRQQVYPAKFVSDYQFIDEDGVEVIISLYLDPMGNLYELNICKTDFSPLIKMPAL